MMPPSLSFSHQDFYLVLMDLKKAEVNIFVYTVLDSGRAFEGKITHLAKDHFVLSDSYIIRFEFVVAIRPDSALAKAKVNHMLKGEGQ